MFKKLMIGVFGLSAILLAILIGFSGGENKSKSDYNADAMTTCNSVIPQKYPNWKVVKKYKMMKAQNDSGFRWSWVISKGNSQKTIKCIVKNNGKYLISEER